MPDAQLPLSFGSSHSGEASASAQPVPHLRDEIARTWGLALGERVEITFQLAFPLDTVSGLLELRAAPDFPWSPRQPLQLRIAGCDFTTRDIQHWKLL